MNFARRFLHSAFGRGERHLLLPEHATPPSFSSNFLPARIPFLSSSSSELQGGLLNLPSVFLAASAHLCGKERVTLHLVLPDAAGAATLGDEQTGEGDVVISLSLSL